MCIRDRFNTDDVRFGGSGVVNTGVIRVRKIPDHDMKQSIELTVPPLAAVYLKGRPRKAKAASATKAAAKTKTKAEKSAVRKKADKPAARRKAD